MLAGSQLKSNQAAMTLKVSAGTAVVTVGQLQPLARLLMCSSLQDSPDSALLA
jgi:hypothetical protein